MGQKLKITGWVSAGVVAGVLTTVSLQTVARGAMALGAMAREAAGLPPLRSANSYSLRGGRPTASAAALRGRGRTTPRTMSAAALAEGRGAPTSE